MMFLMTALVMRALIPVGFMPGTGADAGGMVICTAAGDATIPNPDAPDHKPAKDVCGFAVNLYAVDAAPAVVDAPLVLDMGITAHVRALAISAINPLPPSRGPPAFS